MRDKVAKAWQELLEHNRVLAYLGLAHAILLVVLVVLAVVDDQQITGANRWIKPIKFAASVAIYAWTLGWYLGYLKAAPASVRVIARGVSFCMGVEIACIVLQAARGTISHFNTDSGFDVAVFAVMGLLIVTNTLFVLYTLVLFCVTRVELPPAYLWGIRLGTLIFLVSSLEGFFMTSQASHSVGVPDGGPGIPLLNWSTAGGDLRVAHFIGLHALQLVPLAGYLLSQRRRTPLFSPAGWTAVIALAYALVAGGLFMQALHGRPLIAMQSVSASDRPPG